SIFHTDATQALGKISIDVKSLGIDLMSLSAHKIYGPKGVGAIYIRKGIQDKIRPLIDGGGQQGGLRAGTLNVPGIVGFGKACELTKIHLGRDASHCQELADFFFTQLKSNLGEVSINGGTNNRIPGNLNIRINDVDNAQLIGRINTKVAISTGSACTSRNQ